MSLTLDEVRRRIVIAMVSDDELMNMLVLKGGNALTIVHEVGHRASLDMDYSIAAEFTDIAKIRGRIFRSLARTFREIDYVVFDESLVPKPNEPKKDQPEWWGGYYVEFKLAKLDVFERFGDDIEALRRNAEVLGPAQRRKYTIDISKNEYCAAKVRREIEGYTVYVYSLEMIAIEKLRAICQQMPEYAINHAKRPRARDFYDIYEIAEQTTVNLASSECRALFEQVFAAKGVQLSLLDNIQNQRGFHAPDWPAVSDSISVADNGFDFYFDYVVALVSRLQAAWEK